MSTYKDIFSLKGRTALVTGSSRGIGAAIAQAYAAYGARVVLHGQKPGATAGVEQAISAAGGDAVSIQGELSPPGAGGDLISKSIVSIYAATKAAQHNLIQSLARDYAPRGVLLNTLAPGLIDTDRNAARRDGDPEGWENYVRTLNWMGRAGAPDEMVGAALFLASNACSFMTGEAVVMSGGY
ncbi:hypothetical protein BMJ22_10345 [Sinorhizobium medicae]|nr:hypothetical protein BMJ22_10345 [Sinorhizobium medicae]